MNSWNRELKVEEQRFVNVMKAEDGEQGPYIVTQEKDSGFSEGTCGVWNSFNHTGETASLRGTCRKRGLGGA